MEKGTYPDTITKMLLLIFLGHDHSTKANPVKRVASAVMRDEMRTAEIRFAAPWKGTVLLPLGAGVTLAAVTWPA